MNWNQEESNSHWSVINANITEKMTYVSCKCTTNSFFQQKYIDNYFTI